MCVSNVRTSSRSAPTVFNAAVFVVVAADLSAPWWIQLQVAPSSPPTSHVSFSAHCCPLSPFTFRHTPFGSSSPHRRQDLFPCVLPSFIIVFLFFEKPNQVLRRKPNASLSEICVKPSFKTPKRNKKSNDKEKKVEELIGDTKIAFIGH